jgi:glycosyltransferase involved in cell wall biosynthesis
MVLNHTFYIKNQTFQKSNNPKISIIISTCNAELYINNTLFSIQNQDFTDIEIVIVDDMSEDNTVNIIKELMEIDPRIQLYINEENKGTIYTKTKGVLKSTGKYVMILDQDDMYTQKDAFSTLYNYMEEQNFDILGFSAIFTSKFPFGKPGYVHYYFERPILHHPELSRQMYVQYGKYVRKVGWYIWNFIFKNDLFKRTINQIDEKIINTKMNKHEDIILFFLLTRNANNLKQISRIFYSQNHFKNLNNSKAYEKYINERRNNNDINCLSNINLIEFLLKYTKDEIDDKRIASYELKKAYLDNDCRNCDYIRERGIFVCNLFLENKYIENDIKDEIYKFLNNTDKNY